MSKKANATSIGLFIVIGVTLAVIGVILFSSSKVFSKRDKFILYFDSSLKGLNPGAPVNLQGVAIGSVLEVLIHQNQRSNDYAMPVIIEINEDLMRAKSDRLANIGDPATLERAVSMGLRGKLEAQSLVTGLLYVDLQFMANAQPPQYHQIERRYREIPTVPTQIEALLDNLAHLDVKGISEKLNAILSRMDASLTDLRMKEINEGLTNLLASLNRTANSRELTNTLASISEAVRHVGELAENLNKKVDPVAASLTNSLDQAQRTLGDVRRGVQDLTHMLAPDSPIRVDLGTALDELSNAARSISELADFLKRNPNALITGRKPPQTKP